MSMVLSDITEIEILDIPEGSKQFLAFLWRFIERYPHNRILLYAFIFCAYELGASTLILGDQFQCTDRNIRYILAEVRASRRGEGKTGRPPGKREEAKETESGTIGITCFGGLWALVPWILSSNLLPYCQWLSCAGVVGTPVQLVLTLLALAVCGLERIWALNDVGDRGFALFTGRWTPLRASQVCVWLKHMAQGAVDLFYQGTKVEEWRLVRHTLPCPTTSTWLVIREVPRCRREKSPRTDGRCAPITCL